MQSITRLRRFRENQDEFLTALVEELNRNIRNEIVIRFIEHRSRKVELEEAFDGVFLEESAST